jgi:hypothetical protein
MRSGHGKTGDMSELTVIRACDDCDFAAAENGDDGLPIMVCLADGHRLDDEIDPEHERCPGCPRVDVVMSWPSEPKQGGPENCDRCRAFAENFGCTPAEAAVDCVVHSQADQKQDGKTELE